MQPFPHFHWIALDGRRPNIPENFIRDEFRIVAQPGNEDSKMQVDGVGTNVNPQTGQQSAAEKKSTKVVPPVIHNISKELQIFLDNFEQRFRKEVKVSRLSSSPIFNITKELEISKCGFNFLGLNVIQNEPGVVELLPYIMEFLMSNLVIVNLTN
jgi:hypothetical protein